MPIIKSISDLRNKSNELSKLVHKSNEPVFITKNGEGDMVLMSIAEYRRQQLKIELFRKLSVAESQYAMGDRGKDAFKIIKRLRKRINDKKKA